MEALSPGLISRLNVVLRSSAESWTRSRIGSVTFSFGDQAFSAGAMFLANVVLARTQTKEEYGLFALSYSIYTFLLGLHNAAILEPYTVYGSGKYHQRFREYFRLMLRSNGLVCLGLMALLALAVLLLLVVAPQLISRSMLGLALTVGILLTATFLRRTFYTARQAHLAAGMSLVFFAVVCVVLWVNVRMGWLNGFSIFVVVALGWIAAVLTIGYSLISEKTTENFTDLQPTYWQEHWKYARWVLATSFVFQLTTQGYYWLVAGALSVKEVAELRTMYIMVAPADQIFIALSLLILPRMANHHASKRPKAFFSLWKRYGLLTCLTTVSLFLAIRTWGAPIVHWLYAGKFDDVVGLLYLLAVVPIVVGIGNTINDALKSMERPNVVFYAYLSSGIMTFIFGIPLVKYLGLQGAVIGMLLSAAAYSSVLAGGFFSALHGKPAAIARAVDKT